VNKKGVESDAIERKPGPQGITKQTTVGVNAKKGQRVREDDIPASHRTRCRQDRRLWGNYKKRVVKKSSLGGKEKGATELKNVGGGPTIMPVANTRQESRHPRKA